MRISKPRLLFFSKHQQSLAIHQAAYFRSAVFYQTDMQYWNTVARAVSY